MSAQLSYLDDTSKLSFSTSIERVLDTPRGTALVLEASWFYPQGGGQPSDRGVITGNDLEFAVTHVELVDDDVVHFGNALTGTPEAGTRVDAVVDASVRQLNSLLHSGGHIVMAAVDRLVGLPAVKGYHFPDGPYVEFDGTLPPDDRPEFPARLQEEVDALVGAASAVNSEYEDVESLRARGVHIPMEIPTNKPTRVVTMAGYDSPCGGTHVANIAELQGMRIRKVKAKSGRTKVSYEVDASR